MKQTTGACSGPCISYYIAAVVEALLFACTNEQEQASEDYGEWIKELVKLYEQVAFQLNRNYGPWMVLGTAVHEGLKNDVQKARDEMAQAAGTCADKIPIVKFYSWSLWIKILMHHGLFQKVPFEIQEKMAGFLDNLSKKKSALKLAPVMLRANRLTALFGWHYESFMWNCRDNCRPQMVAVRVAVNEFDKTGSIDRISFRVAAKKRGAMKLVLDRFFVAEKSKYRDRIFDEIVKESVLDQEEMVFGTGERKGKRKKKVEESDSDEEEESDSDEEEESDSDEEEDVHQRYKSGEKEGECRKNCSGCHH